MQRRIHIKKTDIKFKFFVIMQLTSFFDFIQLRAYNTPYSK